MKSHQKISVGEQNTADAFKLDPGVADVLRGGLAAVAERTVAAIVAEVPSYADPFRGPMGETIQTAVRVALDGFLDLASGPRVRARRVRMQRVHDAAYALGQGEARAGRTMDALTSAYRVGARVAWRDIGAGAIAAGLPAAAVVPFAELMFSYINDLSVSSINGHTDELASSGRIRQRRLERLCLKLLDGAPEADLRAAAELAEWGPPARLTAVLVVGADAASVELPVQTLVPGDELDGLPDDVALALVPESTARDRGRLLRALAGVPAIVGPSRPWMEARGSYTRAAKALALGLDATGGPLDTDAHLLELVIGTDSEALADLRSRVLAPLESLNPGAREKLTATLAAWLVHHGRRDDIAAALFVHPQTVRYRMGQLRDLYGDGLSDPRLTLELTVALGTFGPLRAVLSDR